MGEAIHLDRVAEVSKGQSRFWRRQVEEKLPEGTVKLCCDHCETFGVFDLRQLRPASVKLLLPSTL